MLQRLVCTYVEMPTTDCLQHRKVLNAEINSCHSGVWMNCLLSREEGRLLRIKASSIHREVELQPFTASHGPTYQLS